MEKEYLIATAIFIAVLAFFLLGLFFYLVHAARKDSRTAITRLHAVVTRVRELDQINDRTFNSYEVLLTQTLRRIFTRNRTNIAEQGSQTGPATEDLEQGPVQESATQTDPEQEPAPECATQTDLEQGPVSVASQTHQRGQTQSTQTDLGSETRFCSLPPIMVRPLSSNHITIPVELD